MTEIFISYSRRNKKFVEQFIQALHENKYSSDDIWVDWEDIPKSSKWEREIQKGIQESNSIIFILSPEWAASKECAKELKYAVKSNKRLFPIIHKDVDPKAIPDELSSLNWIYLRKTDTFKEGIADLLKALKTDLDYVEQHTNLLNKAKEWVTNKRDNGSLLRGAELLSAETWLSQSTENKQPRPTKLQREFITTSRADDTRQQRNKLRWVITGLVVSVALAISAVIAGISALRQKQVATASQLAALSSTLVNTQPDLSLLLSLEANFIGDKLQVTDPAWLGSLLTSLNSSPKLDTYLRQHTGDIRAVAFSADGLWLASVGGSPYGEQGEVILWDLSASDITKAHQTLTGGTNRFLAAAFSPDSTQLAAAGDDKVIYVWDLAHCCAPTKQLAASDKVRALTFATIDGQEYITASARNKIYFWDREGVLNDALTLQIPSNDPETRILSLAVSSEGELAAGDEEGHITLWNLNALTEEPKQVCSYDDPATDGTIDCDTPSPTNYMDIRGLAFNTKGTLLVAGSSDNHAWLWDAQTGEFLAKSADRNEGGHINTVSGVAFNPDKNKDQVATVSWDNTVKIWNLIQKGSTWSFSRTDTLAGHTNSIWAVAYSPDGQHLASGSSDTTVILWDLGQISQIGFHLAQMQGETWALTASSDGKQLAAGDEAGNIRIWNFDGVHFSDPINITHEGGVLTLAYSHDNKWLASAGYDKSIRVWNTQTGEEAWHIDKAHDDQIWQVMFSPNDQWLASVSYDATAKIWDTSTQEHGQVGITLIPNDPAQKDDRLFTLTFNKDGTKLLVAGYASNIYVWDVSNPASFQSLDPLTGHSAAVNSLAFNWQYPPLLASTSDDKTLLIWDTEETQTGFQHTSKVVGLNESMEAVTFNPNGTQLASATNNSTVLLWQLNAEWCAKNWDPTKCKPSRIGAPLSGHHAPVENVVYLSDTALVSSSEDGQLIFWNLDKGYWYKQACKVVNRTLTDSENNQYTEGKINNTLLNVINWFKDTFSNADLPTPPSCIRN